MTRIVNHPVPAQRHPYPKRHGQSAEHVIVFAYTFDPIGYGAPRYNYRMRSDRDPEGRFDPGITWILLNATTWDREDDSELAKLLRYMDRGDVAGELCTMIDGVLEKAHGNSLRKESARQMMTVEQRIEWAESVGEERGHAEGRAEGRAEGAALEREDLNRLNKHLMDAGRMDDLARSLSDPEFQQQLLDELKASEA